MHRAIPTSSKILTHYWNHLNHSIHKKKLKNIRSKVDNSCPPTMNPSQSVKKTRINNKIVTALNKGNKSINTSMRLQLDRQRKRKRELVEQTIQNYALLKRIVDKKPFCNVRKWQHDRQQHEKRLQYICEYPYRFGSQRNQPPKRLNSSISLRQNQQTNRSRFNKSRSQQSLTTRYQHKTIKLPVNPQPKAIFTKLIQLQKKRYQIDIYKSIRKVKLVLQNQIPEKFTLELDYQDALALMGGVENYNKLVKLLDIENGEVVLNET